MGTRLTRRLAAAVLAAAVTSGTVMVAVAPAAAVPSLTRQVEMSNINSSTTKSVTADCPEGTTVIGGGGYAGGAGGSVVLTGLEPVVSASGSGYRTTATEDEDSYPGDWYVVSYALCASTLLGLEYLSNPSTTGSNPMNGIAAECPRGKKVIGTGAVIDGGGRHVGLSHVLPNHVTLATVAAVAHEDETGYDGDWSVTAFAVCAFPLPRMQAVVAYGQTPQISAVAVCPDSTQVHGVGGYIAGGWGEVRLVGLYPYFLAAAYLVGGEDGTGYGGEWTPFVVAICAG